MTENVVFGGGCFWCTEAVFRTLKGVKSVESGYAGPEAPAGVVVTYDYVSTGETPYVESVDVTYDPEEISFEELLQVFFASHDPTSMNRQGNDVGPQYRSAIFYTTERQREKARHYIDTLNRAGHGEPIVTEVVPLQSFYSAEHEHQQYFKEHPEAAYCTLVIAPKVEKIEQKFKHLLI